MAPGVCGVGPLKRLATTEKHSGTRTWPLCWLHAEEMATLRAQLEGRLQMRLRRTLLSGRTLPERTQQRWQSCT